MEIKNKRLKKEMERFRRIVSDIEFLISDLETRSEKPAFKLAEQLYEQGWRFRDETSTNDVTLSKNGQKYHVDDERDASKIMGIPEEIEGEYPLCFLDNITEEREE